jgi:hypothetical protein
LIERLTLIWNPSLVLREGVPVEAHVNILERKEGKPILERSTRLLKWCFASSNMVGQGTPVPWRNLVMMFENVMEASGTAAASWQETSADKEEAWRYGRRSAEDVISDVQTMLRSISEPPSTCLIY